MSTANPAAPAALAPPARGLVDGPVLPWVLTGFGLVSLYGSGELAAALRGLTLPDTDDAMRLAQVRDLVAGQSWFDLVQHRFLPPHGVLSHWSRLVDAPLALGIAGLTPLLGPQLAERLTTALWPPLLFLAYALLLHRGVSRLFGPRAAVFALFAATQTIPLTMQFAPGRIDHHGLQILLMLGLGFALIAPAPTWRSGALGGALAALSLAIGLEALPVIASAGLVLAFEWWRRGAPVLPPLLGFGLGLPLSATALFLVQTAPPLYGRPACDALSPPWLQLAATGAVLAAAAALLRPGSRRARLVLILGVGAAGLAVFAALFPACLHGPFAGMPDDLRRDWLDRVREMQPLAAMLRDHPAEALAFAGCVLAAPLAAVLLAHFEPDATRRRALGLSALLLALGAVQTLFQLRGVYVGSALVPLVAGLCLDRALPVSGSAPPTPRARAPLLAGVLALNAQVWLVGGRLAEAATVPDRQEAARTASLERCTHASALAPLDALPAGTVLAPIDLGPYLLVHTHHAVAAAPYHRAPAGLAAGLAVAGGDEAAVRREAGLTGATYLALCPSDGTAGEGSAKEAFAARLARGAAPPDWLAPVALPEGALRVWRIR